MSPRWSRDAEPNLQPARIDPAAAESNIASTAQPVDLIIGVPRSDLSQLQDLQRMLIKFLREALEIRGKKIRLPNRFFLFERQTDNANYFWENLFGALQEIEDALDSLRSVVDLLDHLGARPETSLRDLESKVKGAHQLLSELNMRRAPAVGERESEILASTHRTVDDVEQFFKWVATSCEAKSMEVMESIEGVVRRLLEGPRGESTEVPARNDAGLRAGMGASYNRTGGYASRADVATIYGRGRQ